MFYLSIMNGASYHIKVFISSIMNQPRYRSKGHKKKMAFFNIFYLLFLDEISITKNFVKGLVIFHNLSACKRALKKIICPPNMHKTISQDSWKNKII
jgi:hypothetical protein